MINSPVVFALQPSVVGIHDRLFCVVWPRFVISAEHGALLLHAHTGMAIEGAQTLGSDCRKQGRKASNVLIAELQLTLTEGGGMDVFKG